MLMPESGPIEDGTRERNRIFNPKGTGF
ncbi:uncharacterized protein METZ01_LOCUS330749 [marine metagenome]|uniref:Uncharacterized protein n=1 Tax=marine metagenome TaxID=408172 RepID=A0A382PYY8_9ZZZZ